MTDQEIIKAMAEKVMGWEEHHLLPYSWVKDGNPVIDKEQFDPLTNANHWMLVVERMRERGYYCEIYLYPDDKENEVKFGSMMKEANGFGKSFNFPAEAIGHAVCEASIKALEGK